VIYSTSDENKERDEKIKQQDFYKRAQLVKMNSGETLIGLVFNVEALPDGFMLQYPYVLQQVFTDEGMSFFIRQWLFSSSSTGAPISGDDFTTIYKPEIPLVQHYAKTVIQDYMPKDKQIEMGVLQDQPTVGNPSSSEDDSWLERFKWKPPSTDSDSKQPFRFGS
jgi:hypothetical protein